MLEDFIGRHRIRLEPPDVFMIANDGVISLEDATALMRRLEAFIEGKERVFLLIDVTRAANMALEARQVVVSHLGRLPIGGIAIFGATFSVRVASSLMAKAASLLYPTAPSARFFATEADARAWLGERRGAPAS